jgi:hypothetical protein
MFTDSTTFLVHSGRCIPRFVKSGGVVAVSGHRKPGNK